LLINALIPSKDAFF